MKKQTVLIMMVMLIIFYSLVIISDKNDLFDASFLATTYNFDNPVEPTVYWQDNTTGELFECGKYNYKDIPKADYLAGNYFSEMVDYCTDKGYHCDTWGTIASIYTSTTGQRYINCEWQTDMFPIKGTNKAYQCGAQNSIYSYQFSFGTLINYCNELGYWNCESTYNGRSHSWYCNDKEPDTICYSCAGEERTQDIFLKECPTGWTTNASVDCRPYVDCFQCSDETVHVESFQGECLNDWSLLNQTVIDNVDYCKNDNVIEVIINDYVKEYPIANIVFIILFVTLILLYFKGKE